MIGNTAPNNNSANLPTNITAQRLGLVLVLLILIVFGSEFTLSALRRRTIQVSLRVNTAPPLPASGTVALEGTAAPTIMPTPTEVPGQPTQTKTPAPALVSITPRDQLLVDVQWNYRIGPRFQRATVHAVASIQNRAVAEGSVLIDCGNAVLECNGSGLISLNYTVPDTGSGVQKVDWPLGDYVLMVESQVADLAPMPLQQMAFQVR